MAEAKTELGRQDLAVGGDNAFRKDQDYALLRLDRLSLLVPQREIRTLEPAADLDPDIPSRNGVGWVNLGKQRWPVYCFSAELASSPGCLLSAASAQCSTPACSSSVWW